MSPKTEGRIARYPGKRCPWSDLYEQMPVAADGEDVFVRELHTLDLTDVLSPGEDGTNLMTYAVSMRDACAISGILVYVKDDAHRIDLLTRRNKNGVSALSYARRFHEKDPTRICIEEHAEALGLDDADLFDDLPREKNSFTKRLSDSAKKAKQRLHCHTQAAFTVSVRC